MQIHALWVNTNIQKQQFEDLLFKNTRNNQQLLPKKNLYLIPLSPKQAPSGVNRRNAAVNSDFPAIRMGSGRYPTTFSPFEMIASVADTVFVSRTLVCAGCVDGCDRAWQVRLSVWDTDLFVFGLRNSDHSGWIVITSCALVGVTEKNIMGNST